MSEKKIDREQVLDEHHDGSPHITVDESGTFRHYNGHTPSGEVMPLVPIPIRLDLEPVKPRVSRVSSGPAKVTSDAYRSGWDAICWGQRREEKPS